MATRIATRKKTKIRVKKPPALTVNVAVPIASLLPPVGTPMFANDCVLMVDGGFSIESGFLWTNETGVSAFWSYRNPKRTGFVWTDALYDAVNRDSEVQRVQPGLCLVRWFPTWADRDATSFTEIEPRVGASGQIFFDNLPDGDYIFEIRTNNICSIIGGTTSGDSHALPGEGATEAGLYWAISHIIVGEGAEPILIECPYLAAPIARRGDSNDDRVVPEGTEPTIEVNEPRGALLSMLPNLDRATWKRDAQRFAYDAQIWDYVFGRLGLRQVSVNMCFGGQWQAGEMAEDFYRIFTESQNGLAIIWANPYANPSANLFCRRNGDTPWTDSSDRVTCGQFRPLAFRLACLLNDALRAMSAYLHNQAGGDTVTDTFSGSTIKNALGQRAGSVGVIQKILDQFPETKVPVMIGAGTDAAVNARTDLLGFVCDTFANLWAAITGTDANYFRFQPGGADALTGLALRMSDITAQTGKPNDLSIANLHLTTTQHTAVFNAWKGTVEPWFHAAHGIVFVSPTGSNSNAGTRAAPKLTIAAAVAVAGIKWLVMLEGTYNEKLTIPASGASANVPFRVTTVGLVIINGGGARDCISIVGRSNVLIHGVKCVSGLVGINITTSATNVKISDVEIAACSSHAISAVVSGTGNEFTRVYAHANGGDGITLGAMTATTRRCHIAENIGAGLRITGTTLTDDRSWIHGNGSHQAVQTSGASALNNSIIVTAATPPVGLLAGVKRTGGTMAVRNCALHIANLTALAAYAIDSTTAGGITWENCQFSAEDTPYNVYIRVGATGPGGNIVAARSNRYDAQTSPYKFIKLVEGADPATVVIYSFDGSGALTTAAWPTITNTSGVAIESGSAQTALGMAGDPAADPMLAKCSAAAVGGVGVDLSANFKHDFRNLDRTAYGAWDVGPFVIS